MKYLIITCLLIQTHIHKVRYSEKCNQPGCVGVCDCKWVQEYTTGKWFPSKDSALRYIAKIDSKKSPCRNRGRFNQN